MGICYHVGTRVGVGKKSGKWFGCTTLFMADQYGNPVTETVFWESEEAYKASEAALCQGFLVNPENGETLGQAVPVVVTRDSTGKRLATLSMHDTVEPLDIRPLLSNT